MEKGSNSSSSSGGGGGDSFNGLKFGKKIYFEGTVGCGLQGKSGGGPAPAPPSPAKKGRTGVVQGGQPPRCQVEGCMVDLSDAKAYYSRHKVCGMHSKSPKVIVAGIEQRFCQQCSRFHQLPEFDQGKRSCRRRLAGHNERRRKPPPGSLFSPRCGSLCSNMFADNPSKTGGFVMDFSAYATPTGLGNQAAATGKYHFPMQSNSQNPLSHVLLGTTAATSRPGYSGPAVSSEESYGALSLLSNQPWGSRTRPSLSLGDNNVLGGTNEVPASVNPSAAVGQFTCTPWGFKGNQDNNTLHEMPPDLGLGQIGELGLAQPTEGQFREFDCSRGYDSPGQHMHWSL